MIYARFPITMSRMEWSSLSRTRQRSRRRDHCCFDYTLHHTCQEDKKNTTFSFSLLPLQSESRWCQFSCSHIGASEQRFFFFFFSPSRNGQTPLSHSPPTRTRASTPTALPSSHPISPSNSHFIHPSILAPNIPSVISPSLPLSVHSSVHSCVHPPAPLFLSPFLPPSNFFSLIPTRSHHQRTMDIPEILFQITTYLGQSDLCACALVCWTWNDTFTPQLYRKITTLNSKSVGIARHSIHARILRLPMLDAEIQHLVAGSLTRVQELQVSYAERNSVPPIWVALLLRNPELVKLVTYKVYANFLVDIMSVHPNWQELVVRSRSVWAANTDDNWPSFWKICQGLTRLSLLYSTIPAFPKGPVLHGGTLLTMQHLTVVSPYLPALRQMRLISACKTSRL